MSRFVVVLYLHFKSKTQPKTNPFSLYWTQWTLSRADLSTKLWSGRSQKVPKFYVKKNNFKEMFGKRKWMGDFRIHPFSFVWAGVWQNRKFLVPTSSLELGILHPSVLFGMKNDPIFFCALCPFFKPFNILVILLCWKFMGETWAALNPNQHGLTRPILNLGWACSDLIFEIHMEFGFSSGSQLIHEHDIYLIV